MICGKPSALTASHGSSAEESTVMAGGSKIASILAPVYPRLGEPAQKRQKPPALAMPLY